MQQNNTLMLGPHSYNKSPLKAEPCTHLPIGISPRKSTRPQNSNNYLRKNIPLEFAFSPDFRLETHTSTQTTSDSTDNHHTDINILSHGLLPRYKYTGRSPSKLMSIHSPTTLKTNYLRSPVFKESRLRNTQKEPMFGKNFHERLKMYNNVVGKGEEKRGDRMSSKQFQKGILKTPETIDKTRLFQPSDYRWAQSETCSINNSNVRLQESQIIEHTPANNLCIISPVVDFENYREAKAVEKEVGILVSLKIIPSHRITLISNEQKILKILGSGEVLKNYVGMLDQDSYVMIREYYSNTLKDEVPNIRESSLSGLISQVTQIFQCFTNCKVLYQGNLLENICNTNAVSAHPRGNVYKIRNCEECEYLPEKSFRYFRLKYFRALKELMMLLLEMKEDYYSRKERRFVSKGVISFIKQLDNPNTDFIHIKRHSFLL